MGSAVVFRAVLHDIGHTCSLFYKDTVVDETNHDPLTYVLRVFDTGRKRLGRAHHMHVRGRGHGHDHSRFRRA